MRQGQLKETFEGYSQSTRCKGGGGAGRDRGAIWLRVEYICITIMIIYSAKNSDITILGGRREGRMYKN